MMDGMFFWCPMEWVGYFRFQVELDEGPRRLFFSFARDSSARRRPCSCWAGVRAGAAGNGGGALGRRSQRDATDLEVFLEAVWLEKIGEFESAHVTALGADFALKIGNDSAQVCQGVTGAQEFIPHALTVKGQTQCLAGQLAVELMGLLDRQSQRQNWGGRGHGFKRGFVWRWV